MIYLFHGDNEFEKRAALAALVGDMEVVRRDGEELTATEVCKVVMGQSLFAVKQAVVITDASQNVALWRDLPELLGDTATTVVLLETKLDKRTKTYKWLQNHAEVRECAHFTERQKPQLSAWCIERATVHGAVLTARQATTLIDRLGFDQLRLDLVLQQLALAGELNDELIDALVPLAPAESAFELFAAMLDGDRGKVRVITAYLEAESGDDGAYQTLGLLVSQLVQLNALVLSGGDTEAVARDFAAHPYALRKVAPYARRMTQAQLAVINSALAQADEQMKTTRVSPWLLVEAALIDVKKELAMVFKDTELDTQGSDKQQSLDERQRQWMELGLEEKMAKKETEISREAIDNEPALVIAEMAKYVGEECPHLVQVFEEAKRMRLSDKYLSLLAANIDIRLNETRPEELHEIAREIKDNYDTWAEGRAAPPIGSRGPRGDGYKTQYLYESMMGNGLPKEFFDKMAVASVHFNYVYHPDSPQSQIYQQMRLNSGRVSDIDELQEQTLRIADEGLYDAVKLVIGKKEHVIRGVFCETDNYYPQLVTRMITTLEVDKGLPQGTLLERVKMDDLFHRIKEDLGPQTSTRLSRY